MRTGAGGRTLSLFSAFFLPLGKTRLGMTNIHHAGAHLLPLSIRLLILCSYIFHYLSFAFFPTSILLLFSRQVSFKEGITRA